MSLLTALVLGILGVIVGGVIWICNSISFEELLSILIGDDNVNK